MDWDDLRTFLAIARHGTLSGAARALGVTQPTMGRRLAAMEKRTGARLLQRFPGHYSLTPLGEVVLGNAERIEAEALAAERTITGRDVALEGTVRVTTVDTLADRILTPAIAAMQCTHPGITVELVPDTRHLSLSKREADIAVRVTRFEGHEVFARKIGQFAVGLYASRSYLERWGGNGPPRLVMVLDDQMHLPEVKWLRDTYPGATDAIRSNSRDVHLWAVRSGIGIGGLSRFLTVDDPDLVHLNTDQPDLMREIWIGVHGDMRHMPRIRAVMDSITQAIATNKALLSPE